MSRSFTLARGRLAAEAGMTDTCTIRRSTGEDTDENGTTTPTWETIYSGKCRLQQSEGQSREENPGEAHVLLVRRELQLPVLTSVGIRADDVATIDTAVNDPDLVGKVFIIRGEAAKSEATSRRLGIDEVTS